MRSKNVLIFLSGEISEKNLLEHDQVNTTDYRRRQWTLFLISVRGYKKNQLFVKLLQNRSHCVLQELIRFYSATEHIGICVIDLNDIRNIHLVCVSFI